MVPFSTPATGLWEKTKSKAESAGTLSTHSPNIWAHIPGALLRNSSQAPGKELAKHLQQIFRKVFSFHTAAISQASPPSDSLSGYQPRSLTLEVADKRFHIVKNSRLKQGDLKPVYY